MTYNELADALEREIERLGYDELDAFAEEQCGLLLWRVVQLLALGFENAEAVALAYEPIELEEVRKLIARGCRPGTAFRILL